METVHLHNKYNGFLLISHVPKISGLILTAFKTLYCVSCSYCGVVHMITTPIVQFLVIVVDWASKSVFILAIVASEWYLCLSLVIYFTIITQ